MSHSFHCSQCSFRFASGWSHHAGTTALVCRRCGEQFFAKSELSPWGPAPSRRLPIFHERHVSKRKGTVAEAVELFLTAVEIPDQPGIMRLEPATLRCPCCETDAAVSGELVKGDVCPQCHSGTIIDEGFIEH